MQLLQLCLSRNLCQITVPRLLIGGHLQHLDGRIWRQALQANCACLLAAQAGQHQCQQIWRQMLLAVALFLRPLHAGCCMNYFIRMVQMSDHQPGVATSMLPGMAQ